jgi:hypothetical protein
MSLKLALRMTATTEILSFAQNDGVSLRRPVTPEACRSG